MNTIYRCFAFFAACSIGTPVLHAASFDCTKALSGVEQRVCANKELSELDEQLNSIYKMVLKASANPTELRQTQREWLEKKRNGCNDPGGRVHAGIDYCLKPRYQSRIIELGALRTSLENALGVYTKKNPSCSFAADPNDATRNIQVCDGFNEDQIAIRRDTKGVITVEMKLFFFNGHICTFEGTAIWKDGKFVAGDSEEIADERCTFELYSDGRHVISKNTRPACSRHCGARGDFEDAVATKQ